MTGRSRSRLATAGASLCVSFFLLIGASPSVLAAPSMPDTATLRAQHGAVVGAVFDMAPSTRGDAYGPRPPGLPRISRSQIVAFGLQNPLSKAADEHIAAMEAQLLKAKFIWIPVIKTSAILAPGVHMKCRDINVVQGDVDAQGDISGAQNFDFQYCYSGDEDDPVDVQTIRGYFKQLDRAGVLFQFNAEALIPLFTFGKIRHLLRGSKELLALAKLKQARIQQETVLRIYQAHAALLLARESIRVLETAWKFVAKQRTKIEEDLGGRSADSWDADPDAVNLDRDPDDMLHLELGEIELAQKMREARKIESLALSALWTIAGSAAPQGFDIAEDRLEPNPIEGGLLPLAQYKERARVQRPEAKMAAAGVRLRRLQQKMARSNFLPDLGIALRAGVGRGSNATDDVSEFYYSNRVNYSRFYVGLAMKWDLGFHQQALSLRRAKAEQREAMFKAEAAQMILGMEVEQAYRDFQLAEDDMRFTALARDKSSQLLISQQQKETVGDGNYKDIQKSLRKWAEFEFKYFEAVQRRNVAMAKLARTTGGTI